MLVPKGTAHDSPATPLGEAAEETDVPAFGGEARGQSQGQEHQKTIEHTGETAEALPGRKRGE